MITTPPWRRRRDRRSVDASHSWVYGVDNRPKEALEDDEHPWWYMTARW